MSDPSDAFAAHAEAGMTVIELAVVVVVLGTLMSLAVVALSRARLAGNEASAIGSLRSINNAQFAYATSCGRGNYAQSLLVLGKKTPGVDHPYLNEDIGYAITVEKSGYRMNVQAGAGSEPGVIDCAGNQTNTKYYASATPIEPAKSGNRAFATNQAGAIYQVYAALPPTEPFGPPAEAAQ